VERCWRLVSLSLSLSLNPASFISALAEPFVIGKIKSDFFKTWVYILLVHKMNHASVLHIEEKSILGLFAVAFQIHVQKLAKGLEKREMACCQNVSNTFVTTNKIGPTLPV